MKRSIATHKASCDKVRDHAPAKFDTVDELAIDRALDADASTDDGSIGYYHAQSYHKQMREKRRIARAEFDALTEQDMHTHTQVRLLVDVQKLEDSLVRAQKQAQLNAESALAKLNETEYQLHKARAERCAAVLLLIVMTLAVAVGCVL